MNDRDSLMQQLDELIALRAMLLNDTCMAFPWSPSYYEGDDSLKDQMARFSNLQHNRQRARTGLLDDLNARIDLMKYALE